MVGARSAAAAGFLSFLAYLGYGYLDTWHGAATLALLPLFVFALLRTRQLRHDTRSSHARRRCDASDAAAHCLLVSTFGITMAGLTIMTVGMTLVFVPQDLEFMRHDARGARALNPHLVPLIAHDRAGFGGALLSVRLAMFTRVSYGRPSRHLWQALAIAGVCGFTTAIGVHAVIGYNSPSHWGRRFSDVWCFSREWWRFVAGGFLPAVLSRMSRSRLLPDRRGR